MRLVEEENDQFDRLPDALLRLIFNKLHDAQSLSRSMSVCKRFASIIPQVDNVFLAFPRRSLHQSHNQLKNSDSGDEGSKHIWKSLIRKVIMRPLQFLLHIIAMKSSSSLPDDLTDCSCYPPNGVLKSFKEIQSLRIELPGHSGEIGSRGGDSILKWRAEFGKELESCVIVGARSLTSKNPNNGEGNDEQQRDQDLLLNDEELKMRVVWAISCLIAASARHYMLQQVVSDHPMLRSVVVSDGSKQGRVSMRTEQVEELRSNMISAAKLESSPSPERTPVPALKMKLWHVPALELPASGCVMKGATLLVIRPVDGANIAERDGDLVGRVWYGGEEVEEGEMMFGEAAREMMKNKKTYTLEMNSF